jgi:hypothetical protein
VNSLKASPRNRSLKNQALSLLLPRLRLVLKTRLLNPFPGKDLCEWESMEVLEIVNFTVMQMPQEISELNPEVPEDLALVIKTMIAKNKRERVQVLFFFLPSRFSSILP